MSSSIDMSELGSSSEKSLWRGWPFEDDLAQAGDGCRCSYCLLNRLTYSLPFMISSPSALRNLRSCALEARETYSRSSSLSTHAGSRLRTLPSSRLPTLCAVCGRGSAPESRKKSYQRQYISFWSFLLFCVWYQRCRQQ